jgi:hypothetical protein
MNLIAKEHGLISFIVHPDYIIDNRARHSYQTLLGELGQLRSDQNIWMPLPKEVDRWWRERSEMTVVPAGQNWRVEGKGSDRAGIAYACLDGDRLVYEID